MVKGLRRIFAQRALLRPMQPWLVVGAVACACLVATLVALRGVATLNQPEPDAGQHMVRHMRYTFAEVARVDGMLQAMRIDAASPEARRLIATAADHLHIRFEVLAGLSRGPLVEPDSRVAPVAWALLDGLDRLASGKTPIDETSLADLRRTSSELTRRTGDYMRGVEADIDKALKIRAENSAGAWFEVIGSVTMLLVLSFISLALRWRNRRMVAELRLASGRDSLTGLANRRGFTEWAMATTAAGPVPGHALLIFDLDRFKAVNDRYGHLAGDALLKTAADWLVARFGDRGIVARWGGDEFVATLALPPDGHADLAALIGERMTDPPELVFKGEPIPLHFSCGIAVWPQHGATIDATMLAADAALYEAKARGRGRQVFYEAGISERRDRAEALRTSLPQALAAGDLFLEFQPQVHVGRGTVTGVEALVRWRDAATGTIIPPGLFIPILEEGDQIAELDGFVIDEACRTAAAWNAEGRRLRVSVNLSPRTFQSPGLAARVAAVLARHGLTARQFEIEITEGVLLIDCAQVGANLADLAALGVRLALDDFGAGYSNIAYLMRLKPDVLKIDRSFVLEGDERIRASIVQGIMQLAETLGAETLIEGIETAEQLRFVRDTGCQIVQGFLFARPMAAGAIPAFCEELEAQYRPALETPLLQQRS
ncbi:putative bifunctional diguanylate cyclase/phosphodiesterase [Stappia indica]|uniref:EAL domain-containing protein n=1 Tax=Stappia indica TaxID=538381 RepID=A0A857C7N7_9HYPH|nr:bifunctional diguanylate cyclase/phosphodiesterase [Stappia indica]QGZ34879.1 EAL domain-containing protein [Stappia indica]